MKRIGFFSVLALIFILSAPSVYAVSSNMIRAKAAIVMDYNDSILYAKNSDAKLPPASTVKLVTAMVALDNLDPFKTVRISEYAGRTRSIKPRILPDEEYTVSDLLHLALMKSINSAAVALAEGTSGSEQDFVVLMNRKVKEIGANNTLFANASGLPNGGKQYTTAHDLALIMKKALSYPLIKEIIGKKEYLVRSSEGRELFLESTDNLLWYKDKMIGGKTGFTCSARHCFVGAMDTDKGIIFTAVLGASSRNRLWKNTLLLADISVNPQLAVSFEDTGIKRHRYHKSSRRGRRGASARVVATSTIQKPKPPAGSI